jgi:hypothetical protein
VEKAPMDDLLVLTEDSVSARPSVFARNGLFGEHGRDDDK